MTATPQECWSELQLCSQWQLPDNVGFETMSTWGDLHWLPASWLWSGSGLAGPGIWGTRDCCQPLSPFHISVSLCLTITEKKNENSERIAFKIAQKETSRSIVLRENSGSLNSISKNSPFWAATKSCLPLFQVSLFQTSPFLLTGSCYFVIKLLKLLSLSHRFSLVFNSYIPKLSFFSYFLIYSP